ncbi:histidine phosphatase family protein [Sulfitobacter sp. LCG007]
MIRLALLRHGHTDWNRAGRIQGRSDIPLDAQAEAHLAALALPAPWDDATLWSSPLRRARRTAELVAGRIPGTDPALIEMDWGRWEGRHGRDLRADPASGYRDIEHWGWEFRPPGGESLADLRDRVLAWAARLEETALAVCHIGVMRVLIAHALDWNFRGEPPFRIKRDRLFVLEKGAGRWTFDPRQVPLVARDR